MDHDTALTTSGSSMLSTSHSPPTSPIPSQSPAPDKCGLEHGKDFQSHFMHA